MLDPDLLFTEPEPRDPELLPELLLFEVPDLGFTAPPVFLDPSVRGLTLPVDLVRLPGEEEPLPALPGRTWRVRSYRVDD